jgi:hypothetical protein
VVEVQLHTFLIFLRGGCERSSPHLGFYIWESYKNSESDELEDVCL